MRSYNTGYIPPGFRKAPPLRCHWQVMFPSRAWIGWAILRHRPAVGSTYVIESHPNMGGGWGLSEYRWENPSTARTELKLESSRGLKRATALYCSQPSRRAAPLEGKAGFAQQDNPNTAGKSGEYIYSSCKEQYKYSFSRSFNCRSMKSQYQELLVYNDLLF